MSIFVIDDYFFILQVIYCFIVNIVDGVCVVKCIRRSLFSERENQNLFKNNELNSYLGEKLRTVPMLELSKLLPCSLLESLCIVPVIRRNR